MECPFCKTELKSVPTPPAEGLIGACGDCLNPFVLGKSATQMIAMQIPGESDLRLLYPADSASSKLLKLFRLQFDALPVLPEVANRVIQQMRDPEFGVSEMAALISTDAAISGKVLRVANSAVYGGLSRIGDLRGACSRLGLRTVANIVQAIVNEQMYVSPNPSMLHRMQQYWKHSLATAHYCSEIARTLSEPNSEVTFVAGLLHGIGRTAVLRAIAKDNGNAFGGSALPDELLDEIVDRFYPLAGLHLLQSWNLPSELNVSTYFHRQPDLVSHDDAARLTHIVCVASELADLSGYACLPTEKHGVMNLPSVSALGLSDIKIAIIRTDVEERLEEMINSMSS